MAKEQPYIIIQTMITKTVFGLEKSDKIIQKSSNIPDKFKEELWDNYSIDIDVLEATS